MGQNGIATGLLVIFLVVLGAISWTEGASLPGPDQDQADQMDSMCKQAAAMIKAEGHPLIPPKDGRCLPDYYFCYDNSDCCSNRCGTPIPGCVLDDYCL